MHMSDTLCVPFRELVTCCRHGQCVSGISLFQVAEAVMILESHMILQDSSSPIEDGARQMSNRAILYCNQQPDQINI